MARPVVRRPGVPGRYRGSIVMFPPATSLLASSNDIPGAEIRVEAWAWMAILAVFATFVLVDLMAFRRHQGEITLRAAAVGTTIWISVGVGFAAVVAATLGSAAAGQYLTGYVIEESLSVDNVFVWAVIFGYFMVPREHQRPVLFWGIFGALALRAGFIFAGVALLERFSWIEYLFGAFLLYTAIKLVTQDETEVDPEHNPIFRFARRVLPVTDGYRGDRLFVRELGRRYATPLFLVLIMVELTDVLFAVDSVPAVLAVSRSQFIVFTSNAFAIMGLRSIYFLLIGAGDKLVHLNLGLGVILAFVGLKMLLAHQIQIPTPISLVFIAVVLTITVLLSLRTAKRQELERDQPEAAL